VGARDENRSNAGPYPQLMVGGEVVNLARVGVYKLKYECVNSRGLWGFKERKVVVSGHFMNECRDLQISGLGPGNPQFSRMGVYKEKTYFHGRPEFKQVNGSNFVYFR
jgi:hypothetical protein